MPDEIETANVRKMSEILECLSAFAYLAVLTNFTSALFIGLIVCKGIYLGFILVDIVIYIVENCVRIFLFLLSKLSSFGGRILGRSSGARSNNRKGNRGGSASIDRDECLFNRGSQELTTTSNCAGSCQKVDDISTADEMNSEDQILKTLSQYERQAYGYIDKALALDETYESLQDKLQALPLYEQGITELKKGIGLVIIGDGPGFDRARKLKAKMDRNLEMVKERMQHLENLRKASPTSSSDVSRPLSFSNVRNSHISSPRQPPSLNTVKPTSTRRINSPGRSLLPRSATQIQSRAKSSGTSSTREPAAKATSEKLSSLKNVDKKMLDLILNEISDNSSSVKLADIAGQSVSKQALYEIVLLPSLRPELFTGLRSPAKGLLLFGPPGNGKTMLAQAVANESGWVFFNISAASLTSRWMGEGEKLVRALFAAAKHIQKAIIFIDEIDSMFSERKEGEHEASRRMKTQFMVEFSQVEKEQILIIGATNRPFDLDDAVLRRFSKRIYVPMPDSKTRFALLENLLQKQNCSIPKADIEKVARLTEGYSASDLTSLAKDAAMGPIRELELNQIKRVDANKLRDIQLNDFKDSLRRIRPSVPKETLDQLEKWNVLYGDTSAN